MKKLILTIATLLSLASIQAQNHSLTVYDNSTQDVAWGIIELPNGQRVLGGATGYNTNMQSAYILKTDTGGTVMWAKSYNAASSIYVTDFTKTPDSGFLIGGEYVEGSFLDWNMFLIKTNTQGDVVWAKKYGTSIEDYLLSFHVLADGSILATGYTNVNPDNILRMLVMKLNSSGDVQWAKQIHGPDSVHTRGLNIIGTSDGGFAVSGMQVEPNNIHTQKILLSKFGATGNLQWSNLYASPYGGALGNAKQTSDQGYVIIGRTYTDSIQTSETTMLLKTDSLGNTEWAKTFGNGFHGNDLLIDTDNGFIVAGDQLQNAALAKTDSSGNIEWSIFYLSNTSQFASLKKIYRANDNGFLGCGYSDNNSYVIKTGENGDVPCNQVGFSYSGINLTPIEQSVTYTVTNVSYITTSFTPDVVIDPFAKTNACLADIDEVTQSINVALYPNPTTGVVYINGIDNTDVLEMIDITGKEKLKATGSNMIDLSTYPKGVYFLKLIRNHKQVSLHKIILQ